MIPVAIRLLDPTLPLPAYATPGSSGMDLLCSLTEDMVLQPAQREAIPCGFSMALPFGWEAQVRSRSGLALKHGIVVLNSPGTIDSDYRGPVKVILMNMGQEPFTLTHGMRIAQMVILPVAQISWTVVDNLEDTARGQGGFGSTGL